MASSYTGLYECKVVGVDDSRQDGKIQVTINGIGGEGKHLARLCMNCAYDSGGDIAIPKIGETGYVMFANGEIQKPVYMGNTFPEFKTPLPNYDTKTRVISWDSCRIEMKEETMKFIVGEKSLITITGDAVILQVGQNQEGVVDGSGNVASNTSNADSTTQQEIKRGLVTVTEEAVAISVGTETSIFATKEAVGISVGDKTLISATKESTGINSTQVSVTGKTQISISATGELALQGNHIGLNDGAISGALSATPMSSALSTNGFVSSLGNSGIGSIMNSNILSDITSNLGGDLLSNLGSGSLTNILGEGGLSSALESFNFTNVLGDMGNLSSILSPDTLTGLISDSNILGNFGGIENLTSILNTSTFADLGNLSDLAGAFENMGGLGKVLDSGVIGKLQENGRLLSSLGLDDFNSSSLTDILQIPEVSDLINNIEGSVLDVFNDKGIGIISRNEDIVKTFIDENFKKTIEGDEDFAKIIVH